MAIGLETFMAGGHLYEDILFLSVYNGSYSCFQWFMDCAMNLGSLSLELLQIQLKYQISQKSDGCQWGFNLIDRGSEI